MNRIFSIALALVALVFTASAQVGPIAITLGTNRVAAATTNTAAGTGFFVGNQRVVNVLVTAYSTNATSTIGDGDTNQTATLTVRFAGSFDNVTYFESGTNWDVVHTPRGTNSLSQFHQLDSTAVQYFRQNKMLLSTTNLVLYPTATYWYK